jgi:hypothetical protein
MTSEPARRAESLSGFVAMGTVAGVLSTLAFTILHQVLIVPIWFALPAMLGAGALCGACLAWSYALVVHRRTIGTWLQYNAAYLAIIVALGLTSLAVFEPVTTIEALLQSKQPPRELIGRALPVTGAFTLVAVALLGGLYRPGWRGAAGILVTAVVIVVLLGLNISALGLVAIPRSAVGVVAEVLALLLVLGAVYAAGVAGLARSRFRRVSLDRHRRSLHG